MTRLSPGAGVVTTRGDVHYVVTEYGVAYLHGKNVQERAIALISIAHPDFRPRLLKEAVEAKYLRPDLARIEGKLVVGPPDFRTTHVLEDGTLINFRSIRPTDEPRLRDLFYALSQKTIYYRFMSHMTRMPRKQIQDFVYINHRTEVAIVGTITEASGEDLIAIGRYYLDETTNMAEVAFVVRDNWQTKGIGSFLLSASWALRSGTASGASPPRCCARTSRCKPSSTESLQSLHPAPRGRLQLPDGFCVMNVSKAQDARGIGRRSLHESAARPK